MTKLILSDIDGTLLPAGQEALSEELFDLIRAFHRLGVAFCPASGRQFNSLHRLFTPVENEVCFLCENGSALYRGCEPLVTKPLPRDMAEEVIRDLYARPDTEVLVSTGEGLYVLPARPEIEARGVYLEPGDRFRLVARAEDIPGDILRIAPWCHDGSVVTERALGPKWRSRGLQVAVSAEHWMDFTVSDKGEGLRTLCERLSIDPADTVALGDNWNDLPLLEAAGRAYIMDTADPALLRRFPNHCHRAEDTLRELLQECGG